MKKFPLIAAAIVAMLFAFAPTRAQDDADKKTDAEETAPVDYLIISADGLSEVAREWADYRASHGRETRVLTITAISKAADVELAGLTEIKTRIIQEAGEDEVTEGFQVLLLGDCPDEDSSSYDPNIEIPWMLTRQKDSNPNESRRKRIPTDNFYADLDSDSDALPDIAVGRIPARTIEQARAALSKVKVYETAAEGQWMRNLTFFAGEGRFGAAIDSMLENLFIQFAEDVIDQAYNVRMTYANINSEYAYVPRQFSEKVIEEANAGALMLTYLGHGLYDRLDNMYVEVEGKRVRYPILASEHVEQFNIPDGKLPVMMIIACQTGYMDHPEGSLCEKICFTEKAPVAIIASSRDSHPYSNTILQKGVIQQVTDARAPTLGEAFLKAKRELVLAKDKDRAKLELMAMFVIPDKAERDELNRSHLSLYNLTGDPGLRMRYPSLDLSVHKNSNAKVGEGFDFGVRGNEDLEIGKLEVWLEVKRPELAHEVKKFDKSALTSSDEEARSKAEATLADNHANANNKLVQTVDFFPLGTAEPKDGDWLEHVFEGKLDSGLAPGDYILKVFARDPKGERCGFAAVEIEVKK